MNATRLATRLIVALACVALCAAPAVANPNNANPSNNADTPSAHPTFYEDVLPILQANCQVCHRANGANLGGMVAPMAFTSYDEARPWAKSIARQVESRLMPPWHAAPEHAGVFANERTISDNEVATLVNWAKSGAEMGDAANAPEPMKWSNDGWSIGEPDLVLDMGQRYFVEDDVEDQYINFETEITEEMLPEPRWLKAVEFRPGGPVVHHIIARPLGGIAPGNDPTVYNDGYGTLIKPGTKIRWQMHYHKEPGEGTGVWDFSKAALRFYPEGYTPEHIVANEPLARFDFEIPAGEANYTSTTSTTFERDTILLGYTPHMHLRGSHAKYVAKYPDGTEETLLHVPRYDFNWQTHYEYPSEGKRIPAGTVVELTMGWDNSAENPANPDPTKTVTYGGPTTSEMMFGFVNYTDAEPGYVPESTGFLSSGNRREFNPERMKKYLKDRFDIDWDALSEEEQQKIRERFSGRNREEIQPNEAPAAVGGQ